MISDKISGMMQVCSAIPVWRCLVIASLFDHVLLSSPRARRRDGMATRVAIAVDNQS